MSKHPHKYRAVPTVVDNIRFASKREAARYLELKLLEKAGEIRELQLQPRFELSVDKTRLGDYVADFAYVENGYRPFLDTKIVEDAKGFKTPLYKWKKRHVEIQYGITIKEV